MRSRGRAATMATFGAMVLAGLLLTVLGGSAESRLVRERVLFLADNGSIVRLDRGESVEVRLPGAVREGAWTFAATNGKVRLTAVYAAPMPVVTPAKGVPAGGVMEVSAAAGAATHATTPRVPQLLRITAVSGGVVTVKGWRVPAGTGRTTRVAAVPDLVLIVLVRR